MHLYAHIPYCAHKCHYCDFNSHVSQQPPWAKYQAALVSELARLAGASMFGGRKISSIFFGGGTPSLAPPALIGAVIDAASHDFGLVDAVEISLEANPGAVDSRHFRDYRLAGVNRISIGVQSLNDRELLWLERIHGREAALEAFHAAVASGFDNINLDMIYGLPDQSLDDWLHTLHAAIDLSPQHISCYQLTVEARTGLAARHSKRPYRLPDEALAASFFEQTRHALHSRGYEAYEISSFARPGRQCRHNDGYWRYHDYIGIGAGAAGKRDQPDGGISRYGNIRSPDHYIRSALSQGAAIDNQETLSRDRAAAEAVWLGLRRADGIDRAAFLRRFGFDAWEHFAEALSPWRDRGQLAVAEARMRLSPKALLVADEIASDVLSR